MSPKIKAFLIYGLCFTAIFLIVRFIAVSWVVDPTLWTTIIPIASAMILAPKPYAEESPDGRKYGLRSIFLKKPYMFE
ncbi:hypothetical protein [Nonlabens xiamenensis]|uniref:hypothetical protein n=1 Tax=Nonlabens xiamenensis TaxID=2341043 RepID=UPI000F610E9E|nr:hypothetical protein [Nonlabens xiamenensis]